MTYTDKKFTALTGKMTYTGKSTQTIEMLKDDGSTLNGVKMEEGKTYTLNHGDIIDTPTKPIGADDLKWNFRDE